MANPGIGSTLYFDSLVDFRDFLHMNAALVNARTAAGTNALARLIRDHAKAIVGDTHALQPDLAQSTQAQRVKLGFTPNNPLFRDGGLLRKSIRFSQFNLSAFVGSSEPVFVYQEFGTARIPPRPVFQRAVSDTSGTATAAIVSACVAAQLGFHSQLGSQRLMLGSQPLPAGVDVRP